MFVTSKYFIRANRVLLTGTYMSKSVIQILGQIINAAVFEYVERSGSYTNLSQTFDVTVEISVVCKYVNLNRMSVYLKNWKLKIISVSTLVWVD